MPTLLKLLVTKYNWKLFLSLAANNVANTTAAQSQNTEISAHKPLALTQAPELKFSEFF